MTTFPTPEPGIEPAEHPRDTRWLSAGARPTYPDGPVPGDAQPRIVMRPPTDAQDNPQPGHPGHSQTPTADNTAGGANRP